MNDEEIAVKVVEAVIVQPGDTLVITLPDPISRENFDELVSTIRSKMDDTIKVLIIGNAVHVHVLRPAEVSE